MFPTMVRTIRYEAEGVLSFELVPASGIGIPAFTPGSHLEIRLPNGMVRQYSLIDAAADGAFRIAVGLDRNSLGGSRFMHEQIRPGAMIEVLSIANNFALADDARPVRLIAGGIGVTPILAMAEALAQTGRDWRVHYACRDRAHAAFVDRLAALDPRLTLHFDDQAGVVADVAAEVARAPQDAHLYCCGPNPMLDAFEKVCAGRPTELVHLERFGAVELVAEDENSFEVRLGRSGASYRIPQDRSILDVLLEAGVPAPYSCRNGVCGTCEAGVLQGVPDHRDLILSDVEKAAGSTMMLCCSRALSPSLTLDL